MYLNCFGKRFDLANRTHIMGVINCTPDSFFPESRKQTINQAIQSGLQMGADGADFLDVGGESSRPGAEPVSADEEIGRVIPVIRELAKNGSIPVSIDTYKAKVALAALDAGAIIVNDISAMYFDSEMVSVVAESGCPVILMHMKGKPKTMQQAPHYEDVIGEIKDYFTERLGFSESAGIKKENIILDPGIGFGKRLEDNYKIILDLKSFAELGRPVLIGASRKSFIGRVLDLPPEKCLEGTIAAHTIAITRGAHILRVHDVKAAKRAAQISDYFTAVSDKGKSV